MIIKRRAQTKEKKPEIIENMQNDIQAIPENLVVEEPAGMESDGAENSSLENLNDNPIETLPAQENEAGTSEAATEEAPIVQKEEPEILTPEMEMAKRLEEIEKIDITSLEFKERFERRRGERRRGYRRIDERTLVSRAQEEAQSIRELAAKEGYKNGIEEAHNELETLKASLNEFLGAKKEAYDAISNDMLEISLEIAKKIIKKEVELSDDILKGVLLEVFDELSSNEEKITIKVAPDEVEFARASIPEVLENSAIDAKIVIVADESIEKGSCVVIASNGVIDANFSTQLQIIQNAFGIYKGGN